jgi:hypothetical protein
MNDLVQAQLQISLTETIKATRWRFGIVPALLGGVPQQMLGTRDNRFAPNADGQSGASVHC